jgi:hypothetical protein
MSKVVKFIRVGAIALTAATVLTACGGGGGTASVAAPVVESSSNQLAAGVSLTGYSGISLAQVGSDNRTQTAFLKKLFNQTIGKFISVAYAQSANETQCNYDLLKLAGVNESGELTGLRVTTGEEPCNVGFIDMYDGKKYLLLTASGIYKDGLTCNLVLIQKSSGNMYCIGERSKSVYQISGTANWRNYDKLQVSENGNYMFLEANSTVFDQNGRVTGVKTKLLRFNLSNDSTGPVAQTILEGFQQDWNTGSSSNNENEGFDIRGYQALNNGDMAILYNRYVYGGSNWLQKLNSFYYRFDNSNEYERIPFDSDAISSLVNTAISANSGSASGSYGGGAWYEIPCWFKDPNDPDAFLFAVPFGFGYEVRNINNNTSTWQWGNKALILKSSRPAAGTTSLSVQRVTESQMCNYGMGGGAGPAMASGSGGSRPLKIGNTYYGLQTIYDPSNNWTQVTSLVANNFDGTAEVLNKVSTSNSWSGNRKLYASKDYLYLVTPTNEGWTFNSQPGDRVWRLEPKSTAYSLVADSVNNNVQNLAPSEYLEIIASSQKISILRMATRASDNAVTMTGRDVADPDFRKVIIEVDGSGASEVKRDNGNLLQPITVVKL